MFRIAGVTKSRLTDTRIAKYYKKAIWNWLVSHPGWVLKKGRNGSECTDSLPEAELISWTSLVYNDVHGCAVSTAFNAMHVLLEKEAVCDTLTTTWKKHGEAKDTSTAMSFWKYFETSRVSRCRK